MPVEFAGLANDFYAVIGRIIIVWGQIEYLDDRLRHAEASADGEVMKFRRRIREDKLKRNGIVHSAWLRGAMTNDAERLLGIHYKVRDGVTGQVAMLRVVGVPGTEKEQDTWTWSIEEAVAFLKRSIRTLTIGQRAVALDAAKTAAAGPDFAKWLASWGGSFPNHVVAESAESNVLG